ncbi:MAG: holo-ACP synthase [Candidatus Syntrophosphaera sp.]
MTIAGIGSDIVRVERIRRLLEKYPSFTQRVFTPGEIAYCAGKADAAQSYAARFAAKEAMMKALGTGWDRGVNFRDIEVAKGATGRPGIRLHGRAGEIRQELGIGAIHLSLSHEREYALAFVVLELQKA